MKKKVLVIFFSQTGQLTSAVKNTLLPLHENNSIDLYFEEIIPKTPFPYPWSYTEFFDVFPETVNGIACELEPVKFNTKLNYDLVVIAYQPWFLSICIPINSFLQTEQAKKLLEKTNVITVIACRNMWISGQEKMKLQLNSLKANLVGNIVFADKSANLISLVTVLAFVLKGVKGKFLGIFPKYGVSEQDLNEAPKIGNEIIKSLETNNFSELQTKLNIFGTTPIKGNLLLMEGRGRKLFPLYANFISKKGGRGSKNRKLRVQVFGIVLPTAILILSPIITIISRLAPLLVPKKIKKEIGYYSKNSLNF